MKPRSEQLDVSTQELDAQLESARQQPPEPDGYEKLKPAIRTVSYVTELGKSQVRMRGSRLEASARIVSAAKCIRNAIPAFWCASKGRHRLMPLYTKSRSCAAISAGNLHC